MPMRPLVVMTGQGLALADGFDLTKELLAKVPEPDPRFPGLHDGESLDHVFSESRRRDPVTYKDVSALTKLTRGICVPARKSDKYKTHHRLLFGVLSDIARYRVVLHVTANIDGIGSHVAVKEYGARWRPMSDEPAEVMMDDVRQDARDVLSAGRGLLHLPVHGEAGLKAVKGGPLLEGAKRLVQADLRPKYTKHYSTLAQGMGVQVSEIERLMEFSGLGFRLLSGLLTGTSSHDDGVGNDLEPAHLLVVGYAAANAAERTHYPFERRLREAWRRRYPRGGARWRAVVYKPEPDKGEVAWYTRHGVVVVPHGDGDLGDVATRTVEQMLG